MGGSACLDRKNRQKMFQNLMLLTCSDAGRAYGAALASKLVEDRAAKSRVEIEARRI